MGCLLLFAAGCQSSSDTESSESSVFDGRLTFSSKVSDLGLQTSSLAEGKAPEDTVTVTLSGKRYFVPKPTPPIAREMASYRTPVQAASSDYSAFRADDADWILENFSDDDRTEIMNLLADEKAHDMNRRIFSALETMQIWGEAELNGYRLVLVRYNSDKERGTVLTFTETPDGWKRTNALRKDETFDVVFTSFRGETGN